jgi:hypothetical protein
MVKPINVFISYKWQDDAHNRWVERLATDLRLAGINAVLDQWEVKLGDSFTDYMTSKINEADVVLFVMTSKAVAAVESPKDKGGALKFEMQIAAARRIAGERMRLIPVYREGKKTAAHVRDHRYADFRNDSQYKQRLLELVADLQGLSKAPPIGIHERNTEHRSISQNFVDNRLGASVDSPKHDLEHSLILGHINDLNQIHTLIKNRPVMVIGGRGTGKTILLRQLREKLEIDFRGDKSILFIEGNLGQAARTIIEEDTQSHGAVIIDDLDTLLSANAGDRIETLEQILIPLQKWIAQHIGPGNSHCYFLAATSFDIENPSDHRLVDALKDEREAQKWKSKYSLLVQNLHRLRIDPWHLNWKEGWESEFDKSFKNLLRPEFLSVWRKIIIELTGGHPSLFGPIISDLRIKCVRGMEGASLDPYNAKMLGYLPFENEWVFLIQDIRLYIEDFLGRNAVRPLKSTLRKLKYSEDKTEALSFRILCQIALQDAENVRPPSDRDVRQILIDEALMYQDKETGKFAIPGTITRQLIRQYSEISQPLLEVRHDSISKGEIVIHSVAGDEIHSITGAPWRILWGLYQQPDKTISMQSLQEYADLPDHRAVLNAIQRLYITLKRASLDGLVENRRGYGYCLKSFGSNYVLTKKDTENSI